MAYSNSRSVQITEVWTFFETSERIRSTVVKLNIRIRLVGEAEISDIGTIIIAYKLILT